MPTTSKASLKNVMAVSESENSDADSNNVNRFGENKTSHWNRPKLVVPLKELEKVPTQRSKRIHNIQKEKSQAEVKLMFILSQIYI